MRFVLPMLALVPVALALEYAHIGGPIAVFPASALSLIPLTGLIGAALIAVLISIDGESNWLEGARVLRISFYFVG